MPYSPSLRTDPFFTIFIKHLPTGKVVQFEGWVTEFQDNFSSNWSTQNVYGRMDPLAAFENTQRSITLGFDIMSDSMSDGIENLVEINRLIEFLYPMYRGGGRDPVQNTLKAAPLLGLKWTNLINNSAQPGYLYGYINGGLTYAPDMAQGGFIIREDANLGTTTIPGSEAKLARAGTFGADATESQGVNQDSGDIPFSGRAPGGTGDVSISKIAQKDAYIPKMVSLSFTFNVLHTHLNGWDKNGNFGGNKNLTSQFPNASVVTKTIATVTSDQGEAVDNQLTNEALVLENE